MLIPFEQFSFERGGLETLIHKPEAQAKGYLGKILRLRFRLVCGGTATYDREPL